MKTQSNKKNELIKQSFEGKTISCGIDSHKKNWSVSIYIDDSYYTYVHQVPDAEALKKYLTSNFPGAKYAACYEAGFAGFSIQRNLSATGIDCIVVNPADVPKTNKDVFKKSDKGDSRMLGEALSKGMVRGIYIPAEEIESDRRLVRYRKYTQKNLTAKRNTIKSLLFSSGVTIPANLDNNYVSKNYIEWLKGIDFGYSTVRFTLDQMILDMEYFRKKLLELNKQIRKLSKEEKYKEIFEILVTIPGIGLITAMTLITEIADINRFQSFNKFNSFVGLCPSEFSSGENDRKGKMTPRAHKTIRELIIEAAWVAKNHDPALAHKFSDLTKRMTKKRAIIVIARKLLSRIYAVWTTKSQYIKGIQK